ncbi:hypothetical protein [Holospora undulata]|uniref:Uncharacterized protein n=1 Tax=Holospora undulata HU1 TaxID=1321371 RepID=A0A061JJ11_9PROT|nr:hypothetical protein [Holospora undulata]ETZ05504.1 hypothetical protein K737_300051 [Holospora undulata HU1]
MSKIEDKCNLKKSDSDQSYLSTLLVQQYEDLISDLYSPGIFKRFKKVLKMLITVFVPFYFFWYYVVFIPNLILVGTFIVVLSMMSFGVGCFLYGRVPIFNLFCDVLAAFLEVGYSFFFITVGY